MNFTSMGYFHIALYFCYVLSEFVNFLHANSSARNLVACERDVAELSCENGKIINILDGNYGRTSLLTCPDGPTANTTCFTEDAMGIISNYCQSRQHCVIEKMNELFGNPCPDTYKYLNVLYECVTLTDFKLSVKCEHKTAHLECETGKVIRILDANFGRKSRIICPDGAIHNTNCHAKDSLQITFDECENKNSCNLHASTGVFGDPCPNTNKYLTVRYECIKEIHMEQQPKYNKEDNYHIRKTNYFECMDGKDIRHSYVCNGIEDCPDGEDEFDCDYDTLYACEGDTLTMECQKGEVIKIINGNYGRLSTKICPKDYESQRNNCESANAADILVEKCDGREGCSIHSTNVVFGDPCPDTYKYIEVHYQCVKDPRRLRELTYEVPTTKDV